MRFLDFCLLLFAILVSAAGQLFLKTGASLIGPISLYQMTNQILRIVLIPQLLIGLVLYGLGAVFYILLLTRVDLSVAAPAASLTYIFSFAGGYFLFEEAISSTNLVGLACIICGVILVAQR